MEVPELNFKECASVFVRDEFYENIQAPKYHDFCSFDKEPSDIDAFFGKPGAVIKTSRQFEGTCLEPNIIEVHKDQEFPRTSDLRGSQIGSTTLSPDDLSTGERASVCGSKKIRSTGTSATLAKNQDRVPVKTKRLPKGNIPCNAPIPTTASDRSGSEMLEPSPAEFHHSTENEDPNPAAARPQRKTARRNASKAERPKVTSSISCSIFAASQFLFEQKETSQCPEKTPKDGVKTAGFVVKEREVTETSQTNVSEVKDRKRKPSGKNVDGVISRALESKVSLQSRVSKISRKASVSCDSESCSEAKETPTSSRLGRPSKDSVKNAFSSCATSVLPTTKKITSTRRKVRRNSDQNRRRKPSSVANNAIPTTIPLPDSCAAEEAAKRSNAGQGVSSISLEVCLKKVNAPCGIVDELFGGILEKVTNVGVFSLTKEMGTSLKTSKDSPEIRTVATPKGSSFANCGTSRDNIVDKVGAIPEREQQSEFFQGNRRSVDELLSEKLLNLQLHQKNELKSLDCNVVLQFRGEESEGDLCGNDFTSDLDVGEVTTLLSTGMNQNEGDCITASRECQVWGRLTTEVVNIGTDHDRATPLDVCESDYLSSKVDDGELVAKPHISQGVQVHQKPKVEGTRCESLLSLDVLLLDGCQTSCAESMADDPGQTSLLEQLQNLHLPQADEACVPQDSHEEHECRGELEVFETSPSLEHPQLHVCGSQVDDQGLASSWKPQNSQLGLSPGDLQGKLCSQSKDSVKEPACLSSVPTSVEANKNSRKGFLLEDASTQKDRQDGAIGSEGKSTRGMDDTNPCQLKQNNKRKSIDIAAHKNDLRAINPSWGPNPDEHPVVKTCLQSPAGISSQQACPSTMRTSSLSAGQHKKMKTTCPQPFRLRTEERGALKEVEFNKKVEQYLIAKDKSQFAPLVSVPNKETRIAVKPPRIQPKELKFPNRPAQKSHIQAAGRALQDEEEVKKMRKKMVPQIQKMPSFDRPFKPHRSLKSPTIPNSPNFHHRVKKVGGIKE